MDNANLPAKLSMLSLILICLFCASTARAENFVIDNIVTGKQRVKAWEKSSGQPLWQSELNIQQFKEDGQDYIYIEDNGAGIYGKDKKYQTWQAVSYAYLKGRRLIPYQVKVVFKDKDGEALQILTKDYHQAKGKVFCSDNGRTKTFEFDSDLIDREFMGVAQINYPFAEKRDFVYHLLTHTLERFKMTLKYLGKETVKVGEQSMECYKIQMIPDLGALNIIGAFVPKTYFWYEVAPPHRFVRYEGLESGLGTPYIVIEVVK